jgi:tripartite-type tricarboxylate transporter receptor subunit TctC
MRAAIAVLILALSTFPAVPVVAQQSGRPIRLIVPYPPGGTADVLARTVAAPLAPILGQPVLVENRPGAAGAIGATYVSRAEPDGHTLLFTNVGPSAIAPAMSKSAAYDPVRDFTAVSLVARSPLLLVTYSGFEPKDLQSLIALAKANPGRIEYSSAGIGSFTHLSTELFAQAAGINLLHVPYQGQAPSVNAVVSGDAKLLLTSPSKAMFEMVRAGKLRLIGVSSREPTLLAPGASPIANVLPNFEAQFWFGIVAPAKTSEAAVERLHDGVAKVLADPALAQRFEALGSEVATGSAQAFQQLMSAEAARWRGVVRAANIQTTD